jgi:hypothetical protein
MVGVILLMSDDSRVLGGLTPQPSAVTQANVSAKPTVRIGCDNALAGDALADPLGRNADVLCKAILRKTQGLEELVFRHFARSCHLVRCVKNSA